MRSLRTTGQLRYGADDTKVVSYKHIAYEHAVPRHVAIVAKALLYGTQISRCVLIDTQTFGL